jgi:hypothetical protein
VSSHSLQRQLLDLDHILPFALLPRRKTSNDIFYGTGVGTGQILKVKLNNYNRGI